MMINVDKSNWRKVRLGDVAIEYSNRIQNPSESGLERFIGSKNIGQWDFRLHSWESTDSVTSAMKLFEPKDYLFVRRSLYASDFRERAPRADFKGVCSGDILTIRENPKFIADGFLIAILNHPDIWKYVVANASGSITRRIKWRDLANYEFLLPPIDQQKQLAKLLWAMDEVIEKEKEVRNKTNFYYQAFVDNYFTKKNENWKEIRVDKISKVNQKSLNSRTSANYEFRYLDLSSIIGPNKIGDLDTLIFKDAPSRAKRVVKDKSIIISLVRPYQQANVLIENGEKIIASTGTAVVDLNRTEDSEFIFHQFFSKKFVRYCENRMTGTNYPAITHDDVKNYKVLFPENREEIKNITYKLKNIDKAKKYIDSKIQSSENLLRSLINQIF